MAEITVKGLDKLHAKFVTIDRLKPLIGEIQACGVYLKGKMAVYPRSTWANMPGTFPHRWYERGYGPKWALKGGGINGIKSSETLGRKWTVQSRDQGLTAVVGNNVSYGPYVQSAEKQAEIHNANGWQTDEDVVKWERGYIVNRLNKRIKQMLSGSK